MIDNIILVIELIGVVAFAISGAVVAIDKEMDLVGVVFLSCITSFGGGILRDIIIGRIPAFFTSMFWYVAICVTVSLLTFLFARLFKRWYMKEKEFVLSINNYIDAAGLGAFAVSSVKICIELCPDGGAFLAIMMGLISSIGGGMIRDVCLKDIPFVFRKHIYAVAALVGTTLYYVLSIYVFQGDIVGEVVASVVGMLSVFLIRVFATVFRWNMPKAMKFTEMEAITHEIEEDEANKDQTVVTTK